MNEETIRTDLDNSRRYKQEINTDILKWINIYEGKRDESIPSGKAKVVWKLVKKHGEILVANLVKPFISGSSIIKLEPRTADDVYKSAIDNKLIDFFFNRKFDKSKFIKQLVQVMVKEGTAFIRTSWDSKAKCPHSQVLYNEDIFTDVDAEAIDGSKYIITRERTTVEKLESNPNYDKQSINKFKQYINSKEKDTQAIGEDMHDRDIGQYERKENNEIFLYEYWYKDKDKVYITSFVENDTSSLVLNKEEYEYGWYPIIDVPFYNKEYSIWGKALADIIEDEQLFMTSIVRGVIDNMSQSNNGQKFVRKGALDSVNFQNLISGDPVIEINTSEHINTAIMDGHFNELPSSIYQLLQTIENQAEGLTGVSRFMQGFMDSPNASATSTQAVMSQSQIRLLDIENNIIRALTTMFRQWIEMIVNYIDEEEMLKITGTTWAEEKAKMVQRYKEQYQLDQMPPEAQQKAMMLILQQVEKTYDNSTVNYDFKLKVGTDASNQIKINQINMLMQQASPLVQAGAVPPDIIQELISKLFELFDYPDLADKIAKYKPQPDPMQQQMAQLQMAELKGKGDKEEALAKNAMARTQHTMVKATKEKASIEPEVAKKYTEVAKTAKELQENTSDNNRKDKKTIQQ